MFWDNVACVYDIFANFINRKTNRGLQNNVVEMIEPTDEVLECACGTGLLSGVIAQKCKSLTATDFSAKMLKKADKKFGMYDNIKFEEGNILHLDYVDESFDVVVAANVIHLVDEPYKAIREFDRVCQKGGRIIIPTYITKNDKGKVACFIDMAGKSGAGFKRQFTFEEYEEFIACAGYENVKYTLIGGRIPCAVAVIKKP